jgi:hypothetical protein
MNAKKFYQEHLTNSVPFVVIDGCRDWPAMEKWGDLSYVAEEFGNKSVLVIKLGKQIVPNPMGMPTVASEVALTGMFGKKYTFSEFVNLTKAVDS